MIVIEYTEPAKVAVRVADYLKLGLVAAIPTDTSYGLAADATSPDAVRKVFEIKRRPLEKVVSVFVASKDDIRRLCILDELAERALALLPGRVTLILRAKDPSYFAPGVVTIDGNVGIRLSPHPLPTLIAEILGRPITATSANISGRPPLYSAREVAEQLPGLDVLVDAGELERTPVSTVIDLTTSPPRILREGPVTCEQVKRVLGTRVL